MSVAAVRRIGALGAHRRSRETLSGEERT